MPAFVVHHVQGIVPTDAEHAAFTRRLREALVTTELRITVPDWQRNKDFRRPGCNGNLLRDAQGELSYIDFQNFRVRDPRRLLTAARAPRATSAASRPTTPDRFETVRLLRQHGLELDRRLVIAIGPDTAGFLYPALAAGAWWAIACEEPAAVGRARTFATALGFTRLDILPIDPTDVGDLEARMPAWLRPHLAESIVFCNATRLGSAAVRALARVPWKTLVYEGASGESRAHAERTLRSLRGGGGNVVPRPASWPFTILERPPRASLATPRPAIPRVR